MKQKLSREELVTLATQAQHELRQADATGAVAGLWDHYYGQLGHRVMGRLLLGAAVGDALPKVREAK